MPADSLIDKIGAAARSKVPPLAAPQLGSCASSGRARRLWAAQRSQGRGRSTGRPAAAPTAPAAPGARAIPTSKAADFTALDHAGAQRGRVPRRHVPQRLQMASRHDVFPRILGLHHGTGRFLPDDAGRAHLPFPDPVSGLAAYSQAHGGPAEGAPRGPMVAHPHLHWLWTRHRTHGAFRVEWRGANMEREYLQRRCDRDEPPPPRSQSHGGARQHLHRGDGHLYDHLDSRLLRPSDSVSPPHVHGL